MIRSAPISEIVSPGPDGEPMAESDLARDYLIYGVEALKAYFQSRQDVYVSGNLWISYDKNNPKGAICPDVFIIFGVDDRPRSSYAVWEENGKTPDWVLEVTSKKTWEKDEEEKPDTYAEMGVSEYFQYDPSGLYLKPALKGRRLVGTRYENLVPSRFESRMLSFSSQVLGLEMRLLPDGRLRFFNAQTGEYLRSPDESERERVRERQEKERERQEKEQERQGRLEAEALAAQLAARLRELGIDPNKLG